MGAWPRDRGSGYSSAHPSDFLLILHRPSSLPTASLNHFLKPKIKTQLQLSQRKKRRKTAIILYIKHEMKGGSTQSRRNYCKCAFQNSGWGGWWVGGGRAVEGTKDWTNTRGSFQKNSAPPSTTKSGWSAPHVHTSRENITNFGSG